MVLRVLVDRVIFEPLNPWFSLPIRFSTGTLVSSNVM